MAIKDRLKLNTIVSLGAVALIILSLAWSYHEDSTATRKMDLVAEIRNVAFERIMLRDDYLLHAEERAKTQWHAKSETLRGLLDMADQRFTDRDDRDLLREARKDFDATFVSFSGFMERDKRKESGRTKGIDPTETELMLISQTFLKAYSMADSINRLYISAGQEAARVRKRSIATVFFFMIAGITVIIANSMFLARLLTRRIDALKTGIKIMGSGDLEYRIDAHGDDELSALARGSNEMAGKLKMSHTSVENLQLEIAERKRVEEKLIHIMKAVESASDAIGISDLLGHHFYQNKALSDLFGYATAEELEAAGGGKAAVKDPEVAKEIFGNIMSGKPWIGELEMVTKSGRVFLAFERADAIKDDEGNVIGLIGIITDITERKRAEEEKLNLERQVQQAQKLESLGVLAGGIAHDFNNLLMVVLGHAELALNNVSPVSSAHASLTEITTAARRAADLCRQMLAYAGKSSFELERVALRDLIEEMAHLLKTMISKKAILNLNLERELPPIQGDPTQIRQIAMNLIINASEAIEDRSGVITVSVGATRCDEEYLQKTELHDHLTPGLYVHLEVSDTGRGMDAETRSRIFEPFFSTKFTGRGLGLAAVLGIVRAHKGALKVYSEPGKGTTFKILFPGLSDGEDAILPLEVSPLADWRGTGTILLVDDEESLIALGARMLEHLGFTVLTVADGLQAVECYRERGKEIDLVLMDLTMPHMDGAKAFGELRRLNPDVRVILASGYTEEDVSSRFEGKKPSGIIQKPYTLAKLREALAGLMPKRL
jgi:PAS domain S-box-containing protein